MEHRWGDRRRVTLPVRIRRLGHKSAVGWLTDISLSGAYVRTTAALSLVSRIHVEVDARGAGNTGPRQLRLQGRVVRHGAAGVGIEWVEFASETLCEILRIATSTHQHRTDQTVEAAQDQGPGMLTMHSVACERMLCITP
jgi:hypothetical protein